MSSARPASGRRIGVVQLIGLLLAFLLTAGLGGVLTAGLVMPAVATTNVITDTSVRLFDDLPAELVEVPLSQKSTVLASDGTVLAEFFFQDRVIVPLDQVSQPMKDAVIAIEDHRFYEHGGIDPAGMLRAMVSNFTKASGDGGGLQGGSTLTQQYVKNSLVQASQLLETAEQRAEAYRKATVTEGTEGVARKLAEAKMAIALEQRLTKDEILERYLNISQFGLSVYGVEAASQYYFSIPAKDLNYIQAATIAGITKEPARLDPTRNPEESQARRNIVLGRMHDLHMITDAEYTTGKATPIADTLVVGLSAPGCMAANAISAAGYFCDFVTKIIATDPVFGATRTERSDRLYRGGLTITTTLDRGLQAMADEEVKAGIPVDDPSGVGSAISVVQPGTGYVLAMAQNRNFVPSSPEPGSRSTPVNYNTDNKYGGASGFPPGSTFKPFTLMEWFKSGHSLGEIVNGTPRTWRESSFTACGSRLPDITPWRLANSEGGPGAMSVLDATRNSVNNAYADIASQLDLCDIMTGAAEIGVHKAGGLAGDGPFDPFPANVIGSQSIAPLTMAASFATFAANGTYCEPIAIISVVDSDGNQLPVPAANCRPALDPGVAAAVSYTLSHVFEGTGRDIGALSGGRVAAGKTGTTSENEHTWFVGFTPQISTAVWVGFPDEMKPVQEMTINGTYRGHVYGSTIAGPTWWRFMERALVSHENIGFPEPPSQYIQGVHVKVPNVAGRTVADATRILEEAGFHAQVYPISEFSPEARNTVARTMPGAGSSQVRGSLIKLVISGGPDPTELPGFRRAGPHGTTWVAPTTGSTAAAWRRLSR